MSFPAPALSLSNVAAARLRRGCALHRPRKGCFLRAAGTRGNAF